MVVEGSWFWFFVFFNKMFKNSYFLSEAVIYPSVIICIVPKCYRDILLANSG